ncbi:MAG: hypothetical protein IJA90_02845 [Peptococcaceae bacterium]|nr:hypothetical protein [Peptococcaceae bacterium]
MKPRKVLTILTIVLLALFLTGCGPTLEEKIAEVQAKNTITTSDIVDLLELEGVEVVKQKPGTDIHELWEGVEIYKLDGEGLLLLTTFDGYPWDADNHLYRLELGNRMDWMIEDKHMPEPIKAAVEKLKPDNIDYWYGRIWTYKNMQAVYVPAIPERLEDMSSEDYQEHMDGYAEKIEPVNRVFKEYLLNIQTEEYKADGEYFDAEITSYLSEVPYEYNDRLIYIYLADSKCLIELNEEMVKPYTGQEFSIRCKGPLEGPFASSGSRGISGTIDNELSFSLGASNAETGYGKEPYTGPIQYEVTVTIGDDITETLIVGTEGTDSSK